MPQYREWLSTTTLQTHGWISERQANTLDNLTRQCANISRCYGIMSPQWSEAAKQLVQWTHNQVSVKVKIVVRETNGGQ